MTLLIDMFNNILHTYDKPISIQNLFKKVKVNLI